jgi:hypothetical protein
MQKRRFTGRGLCIPRTSFSVRPGVQFDRNLAAIGLVSMLAGRTVMIAGTSQKAPRERPACEEFKLASIVANAIVDATAPLDRRRTPTERDVTRVCRNWSRFL